MPDTNPLSNNSPSSSLNLSSITEEFLNSPEVTGAQPATPVTPQEQEPVTPPTQEEVTPPLQTQQEQEPPPDPEEQHRGYLRDDDYRRKTMKLADERRAFEAEKQQLIQQAQYAQELHNRIHDPNFLQQQWNRIHQQVQQQDPNSQPTVQQVNQLLQEQLAQAKQEIAAYVQKLEVQRNAASFDQERIQYAKQLEKEFPAIFEDNPGLDRLISAAAWERHPANMDELKKFMREEAETRHNRFKKRLENHEQAAIMRHEKTKKPSIEPKGGNAPLLQTPQRKMKLGSDDLFQSVLDDIRQEHEASR